MNTRLKSPNDRSPSYSDGYVLFCAPENAMNATLAISTEPNFISWGGTVLKVRGSALAPFPCRETFFSTPKAMKEVSNRMQTSAPESSSRRTGRIPAESRTAMMGGLGSPVTFPPQEKAVPHDVPSPHPASCPFHPSTPFCERCRSAGRSGLENPAPESRAHRAIYPAGFRG